MRHVALIFLAMISLVFEGRSEKPAPASDPLIEMLRVGHIERSTHAITYVSQKGDLHDIRYEDTQRLVFVSTIPAGMGKKSTFFGRGPAKGRYELLEVEERDVHNPRTNTISKEQFLLVKDLNPHRGGEVFEIGKGGRHRAIRKDYSATFRLDRGDGKAIVFVAELGEIFTLPPKAEGNVENYRFAAVNDDGTVMVEQITIKDVPQIRIPKVEAAQPAGE